MDFFVKGENYIFSVFYKYVIKSEGETNIIFKDSSNARQYIKSSSDTNYSYSSYIIFTNGDTSSGYVKLTSNENEVDIFVDGELIGQISNDAPLNKKNNTW